VDDAAQTIPAQICAKIIAARETCGRQGELLNLRWGDVSLARGEIILRAEHTKDRENRTLPISSRFRKVLEMRCDSPTGVPFPPSAYVFGDEIGQRVGTYLNATVRGLHESMQNLDESAPACKPLVNKPARGFRPVRKQAPARNGKSFLH
jgi:integrase